MDLDLKVSRGDGAPDRERDLSPPSTGGENPETETEGRQAEDRTEGGAAELKEKAEELLDKVAGPDVPPSLTEDEEETRPT